MGTDLSSIFCVADMSITRTLDQCLTDLALPEVFIHRAKQISLSDNQGFFGLRPVTKLEESRALIYRFYVPSEYTEGIMHRIAEVTDLVMGGRGCIFSQHISLHRGMPLSFNTEKLERLCGKTDKISSAEHALICCVVPRGSGNSLAQVILELGVCVPIVFFGTGMGRRDKLGLLRITVQVEKEILWLIVPRSDADFVEKILIPRARLDVPGKGFIYRCFVHAPVVNLRIRQGKRLHAATMEQVIAALDKTHGSSDWRRLGTRRHESGGGGSKTVNTRGLYFIGEEAEVDLFRRTAMKNGARGATLNELEMYSYSGAQGRVMESRSRRLCDVTMSVADEEKFQIPIAQVGLYDSGKSCVLKAFDVELPYVIRR
jgi:hypothetical protein